MGAKGAQVEAANITASHFEDDDAFLLKYLPGKAQRLRDLRAMIFRLNTENLDLIRFVLLVGDTGTGKNHVARVCAGHRRWLQISKAKDELDPGKDYPDGIAPLELYLDRFGEKMLPAIPHDLVESELFGHVKGAFTGAGNENRGLFRDKGYQDILLDEIGEAPLFLQAKLLAVLEGRPITPVGGGSKETEKCNKRIFMATNRRLREMVGNGQFREDLFFRIRRCTISLPRLAENPELIPATAAAILDRLAPKKFKTKPLPDLSAGDNAWLQKQRWGGNVRELEEVIDLWVAEGCVSSIEAVAAARHFSDQAFEDQNAGFEGNVTAAVLGKIEKIMAGEHTPPGTIQGFIELFTSGVVAEVNAALRDWYEENRRDTTRVLKLFPNMKLGSIRTQMSRGRKPR
jgi:DNA-binding NtrC family response regulator